MVRKLSLTFFFLKIQTISQSESAITYTLSFYPKKKPVVSEHSELVNYKNDCFSNVIERLRT